MVGRPLADDLAIDPWIFDFIGDNAPKLVRRDVANAVAAGLDGMHLDLG